MTLVITGMVSLTTGSRRYPRLMSEPPGRVRRTAEWLGLLSDEPKPTFRRSLRLGLYVLPLTLPAAALAAVAERQGGPWLLTFPIVMVPLWVLMGLLQREGRRRK